MLSAPAQTVLIITQSLSETLTRIVEQFGRSHSLRAAIARVGAGQACVARRKRLRKIVV